MSFYTHTIAAIRSELKHRYPSARAPLTGQPSLHDLPGYVHWMLNGIERMNQNTFEKALQAARWMGWTLRVVEDDLKFWDNSVSRKILGRDISENSDIPKHISRKQQSIETHVENNRVRISVEKLAKHLDESFPNRFDYIRVVDALFSLFLLMEVETPHKTWLPWEETLHKTRKEIARDIKTAVSKALKPKLDPSQAQIYVEGAGMKKISDLSPEDRLVLSDYLNATRL